MVMLIVLIIATILTAIGIFQTKKQGNKFGMAVSTVAFLVLLFTSALAIVL